MKLLLTDSGITNESIRQALITMLGKPIAQSKALFIPTAMYANPGGCRGVWQELRDLGELGWQEFGVLELTALPSLLEEHWLPALAAADAIIVGGGNTPYLSFWMQESGLAEKLPELLKNAVYIGVSAGSMVVTHSLYVNPETLKEHIYYDDEYDEYAPPGAGSTETLRLVPFVLRPHLNATYCPNITLERMEKAAARLDVPMYVIDEQTAIAVNDGDVHVISEGEWKLFENVQ